MKILVLGLVLLVTAQVAILAAQYYYPVECLRRHGD